MCNRGDWRGFHSRYLKTPNGQESPLVIMEQCTSCGDYRARDAEGIAYVVPDQRDEQRQNESSLPDPEAEDGGSVWGPQDKSDSGGSESW